MPEVSSQVRITRTQKLNAVVIRACQGPVARNRLGLVIERCGAPGVYKRRYDGARDAPDFIKLTRADQDWYITNVRKYPQVFVPVTDPRCGQAITGPCPCCGYPRPHPENRGTIWKKVTNL